MCPGHVYSLIKFDTCVQSGNYHDNQETEYSVTLEMSLTPICSQLLHPNPRQPLVYFISPV